MTAADFARLQDEEELERVVEVPRWQKSVRLIKLNAQDFVEVMRFQQAVEKDKDGKIVRDEDAYRFTSLLLSKTIHDDAGQRPLDSDEGRLLISRWHVDIQSDLMNNAIQLCGFDQGGLDKMLETAKKN